MPFRLTLRTPSGVPQATVTLPDEAAGAPAIDVIISLSGPVGEQVQRGWLVPEAMTSMHDVQQILFDRDAEGPFIREGLDLHGPGGGLNPDLPLQSLFQAGPDGVPVMAITVIGGPAPAFVAAPAAVAAQPPAAAAVAVDPVSQAEQMEIYKTLFVLFQIREGTLIDVTKDDPFLAEPLRRLEKAKEVDINVDKAAWMLTPAGNAHYDQLKAQAHQLITRYDIFGDVDHSGSEPRFGTGTGDDLRIAIYELAGLDPFYARFLLGLNDGEWRALPNWTEAIASEQWYDTIFAPVTTARGVDDIGRDYLQRLLTFGSDIVHDTLDEEREAGIDPNRVPNPHRDGTFGH